MSYDLVIVLFYSALRFPPIELKETHLTAGDAVYKSLLFSMIMGLIGCVLPAVCADRMNIVDAFWAS